MLHFLGQIGYSMIGQALNEQPTAYASLKPLLKVGSNRKLCSAHSCLIVLSFFLG